MNNEIQFQNMDSWRGGSSGKFGLTFKQIILTHINRCVVYGSVEWCGGYWQTKMQQAWTDKTYVQNSRDVYCNSVKMLRALLLGYFDKPMSEADKKLQEEFDKNYKACQEKKEKDIKTEWNSFKVEWHIELFEQLIMLSKRLNFFEEETSEEEI